MPRTNVLLMAWGGPFVEKLAAFTLPTLSSRRNLPALAAEREIRFLLYTDRASRADFVARVRPLETFGEIALSLFEETVVDGRTIAEAADGLSGPALKHEIERQVQFDAIDTTLRDGAGDTLFFFPQDMVVADGSLPALQAMIDDGAEGVALPTLRLSAEACRLPAEDPRARGEVGILARELCAGMPDNLHPTTRRCFVDCPAFTAYPASIVWPVGSRGWLCRTFFPTPVAMVPNPGCRRFDSTIDYDFLLNMVSSPDRVRIPRSSDDAMGCKVTTERYLESAPEPKRLSLATLAHFILAETNRAHRAIFDQPYRLVRDGDGDDSDAVWHQAEAMSAQIADAAYRAVDSFPDILPDSPQLQAALASHFGGLDAYLSPMRRGGGV